MEFNQIYKIAGLSVFGSWFVFAVVWIFLYIKSTLGRRRENIKIRKRDPKSIIGIILQAIAFFIIFSVHRDPGYVMQDPGILFLVFTILSIVIAPLSVIFAIYAVLTLGHQWSFAARLINDHKLITNGPYRVVRHPIYFTFSGLFISTALVITPPAALLIATILFIWGSIQRIHSEEILLLEEFGDEYLEYRNRVSMFIPFIY
jgi:protein-S-isoprenylcysteine O-methyltransferase Ste14